MVEFYLIKIIELFTIWFYSLQKDAIEEGLIMSIFLKMNFIS